jgi:hypothetical protein
MAHSLANAPGALERVRGASLGAVRALWRREAPGPATDPSHDLATGLESAAEAGRRLAEQIEQLEENQALANAASICRWELLILRERVLEAEPSMSQRSLRAQVVRHLDGAAAAARTLSSGYRFHNLDRICDGGQALDEHLQSLLQIRARLVP